MTPEAETELERLKRDLLERVADSVSSDAQRFAPVRTGRLRASIEPGPVEGDTVRVWAHASYAGYVEMGTRHMAAQPYLRPALYRRREGL